MARKQRTKTSTGKRRILVARIPRPPAAAAGDDDDMGGLFDEFSWDKLFEFLLKILPMFNCGNSTAPERAAVIFSDKGRGFLRLRNATVRQLRLDYPDATPREIHRLAREIVSTCDGCTPAEIEAFAENSTMPLFDL